MPYRLKKHKNKHIVFFFFNINLVMQFTCCYYALLVHDNCKIFSMLLMLQTPQSRPFSPHTQYFFRNQCKAYLHLYDPVKTVLYIFFLLSLISFTQKWQQDFKILNLHPFVKVADAAFCFKREARNYSL